MPLITIAGYGLLSAPLAALYFPVYVFLANFYAQNFNLSIATIGYIFLSVRFLDAISDPLMGFISDRVSTKFGLRRPWLLVGTPLVMVSVWYLFNPQYDSKITAWYFLFWLSLLTIGWTIILTPYFALGAEISKDYNERSRITLVREGIALSGTVIAALLYSIAVSPAAGLKSVTYFVICSLPLTVVICFFSTGKIKQHKASSNSFFLDVKNFLKALGSEPLFRRLLLAYFINGAANGMPASLFLFFVNNRLETPGLGGLLILIYFVSAIVCIPVWMVLCKKISKHRLWCYAMIYASIIFAFTIFLGSGNWIAFLAICILSGFALGADLALPSSMQADLVDLELLRSGSRRTGAFFSIWSVATKAAVAISSGMGLIILSWSGFTSVGDNTELSLFTLSILYAGVPIVLKLLAVYFIWNFPIDLRQHKKIIDSIESKNFPG